MANRNRNLIPEARKGLDRWKYEVAGEIGLTDYSSVDKGNLTSRENGSVGGEMVKRMVLDYESKLK
ncbi:MAG: alpha/beta-type small acid-soluble spore protein [Clostridiaceae bacterium]|nr:alpha/beta-type small acid-soluble spore protein [Clostridiaceae bacterium]